ncbi:MAG: dihydropteroate synthase [Thermoplasmata archaeon]
MAEVPVDRHRFGARVLETRSASDLAHEIARTDSDPEGVGIITRKGRILPVWLEHVSLRASPLLKQEALAVGADAAHARGVADHSVAESAVVLVATWGQYQRLLPKLRRQPFGLHPLADELEAALRQWARRAPRTVRGAHRSFAVGDRPRVMGVVNVTPDSFSDGGSFLDPIAAIAHAQTLIADGADLIDIGGESTRPGASPVDPEEEWRRIAPVLEHLGASSSVPVSVDTRHAEVARRALARGADLINDVSGLSDPEMRRVVRDAGAAAIVMHMRGSPITMQSDTHYADLRSEVYRELARAIDRAQDDGIGIEHLLVDPGLGFGKTHEQSLDLLAHAGELRSLGCPVVLGASRKSMLGWATGGAPLEGRSEAGIAAAVLAALQGVEIIRAHEVAPTVRALALVRRLGETDRGLDDPLAGSD